MAESQEELKSLLRRAKEESDKAGLKLNIWKTKIRTSHPITSWQIDGEKWKQWEILFSWLPPVTAAMKSKDSCSSEEKPWQTQTVLKSRDITLPTKICVVKAMVFPVIMYGCEKWTIKKAECWKTDALKLMLENSLESPLARSNQSVLKEINPEYSREGLMLTLKLKLKLKLQYLATWCKELTHWKIPWCWERLRAGGEGSDRGWDGWMASST